jgi:hypothetical protein
MKPFYKLDFKLDKYILDNPILPTQEELPEYFSDISKWRTIRYDQSKLLTQEFIDFLTSINIRTESNEYFNHTKVILAKGGPYSTLPDIHVDYPKVGWGINFSWGSPNNEMLWYNIKEGQDATVVPVLSNGLTVPTYTEDQLNFITSTPITLQPTLVRVSIPHYCINHDNSDIWSITIRDTKRWDFDGAVNFFKRWIVE